MKHEGSNFMLLRHLYVVDDPQMLFCMRRRREKYPSTEIQNQLLKIMDVNVLR